MADTLATSPPFDSESTLPYELPPFDAIHEEHFRPAFEAGMEQQRAEVEAIAADPAAPTVENTLDALERSGRLLDRVSSVFFNLTSASTTPGLDAIEAELAPVLSAHRDAITLDRRLFERIDRLHATRHVAGLTPEQVRLVERYRTDFVRAGAALDDGAQQRLRELNAELSTLTTAFQNALLADTNDLAVHLTDAAELDGLPADAVAAAAQAAAGRGLEGWLLTLVLPSQQPALASLTDRSVRERLFRASLARGGRGNEHDTRATLTAIAALRAEHAALLGYADHAAYVVADQTAGTSEAVTSMLAGLVEPAVANARTEQVELEELLARDGLEGPLQPWDWFFYAERVRRERFAVDGDALRPWFELGRVLREGVFAAAGTLYGLTFTERPDLPGYAPDVRVHEVFGPGGEGLGLFVADWYTRDAKRGGAWMSTFVDQSGLLGTRPVTVVNLNVPRPPDGEPTLLTLDEVRTVFHEFGHVLHGLLSDVHYPRLSGTNVPRDFVEFPSQVNEMWAMDPALLRRYAVHHVTGEPLPADVVQRLLAAQSYGQGQATVEILAAALLDLEWHRLAPGTRVPADEVEAFEATALHRHGLDLELVPPRYRSTYFAHVFAGGYSAGYYSYIWSEVLDADTVGWFEAGGGLDRELGRVFAERLLSRGGAVDPMEAFAAVVGRPPRIEPLLARRGLQPAGSPGQPA